MYLPFISANVRSSITIKIPAAQHGKNLLAPWAVSNTQSPGLDRQRQGMHDASQVGEAEEADGIDEILKKNQFLTSFTLDGLYGRL